MSFVNGVSFSAVAREEEDDAWIVMDVCINRSVL